MYEAWVGGWVPSGLKGDDIAIGSRVARAAMDAAFFGQLGGVDAAVTALRRRAGVILDPAVVATFVEDAERAPRRGRAAAILATASSRSSPRRSIERGQSQLLDVAAAFGDLADVKTPFLHGHAKDGGPAGERRRPPTGSRRRATSTASSSPPCCTTSAASGVSNAVWEKPGPLTRVEWEQVRMHGYYSERILAGSPSLEPLSSLVGMHHERLDGSGYHRGVRAPPTSRSAPGSSSAADAFAAMVQDRPHRPALAAEQAADELMADAEAGRLDHDAAARRARRGRPA